MTLYNKHKAEGLTYDRSFFRGIKKKYFELCRSVFRNPELQSGLELQVLLRTFHTIGHANVVMVARPSSLVVSAVRGLLQCISGRFAFDQKRTAELYLKALIKP